MVPKSLIITVGSRSFGSAALVIWNTVPPCLCIPDLWLNYFKESLQTTVLMTVAAGALVTAVLWFMPLWNTLTLTLIHPVSNWTHWATLWRHPYLSRAATSASSQVNPICCRSLLTVLLPFALGRPGTLLYPGTCQYSGMRWWSIQKTCPRQRSRLSLSMLTMVCCPVLVLTSSFVILSFSRGSLSWNNKLLNGYMLCYTAYFLLTAMVSMLCST